MNVKNNIMLCANVLLKNWPQLLKSTVTVVAPSVYSGPAPSTLSFQVPSLISHRTRKANLWHLFTLGYGRTQDSAPWGWTDFTVIHLRLKRQALAHSLRGKDLSRTAAVNSITAKACVLPSGPFTWLYNPQHPPQQTGIRVSLSELSPAFPVLVISCKFSVRSCLFQSRRHGCRIFSGHCLLLPLKIR